MCIRDRFYNKTLELQQKSDKPYIRQSWYAAGLVDDWSNLTKKAKDGTIYKPEIWRVEFSIKSGTKNWFLIEDQSGKRVKKRSIRHTLAMYDDKQKLLDMFFSLAEHYFHFKVVEYIHDTKSVAQTALSALTIDYNHPLNAKLPKQEKKLQRKDRCADKLLFRTSEASLFFKLENVASAEHAPNYVKRLIQLLYRYREDHTMPDICRACNTILENAEMYRRLYDFPYPWPQAEVDSLRKIVNQLVYDGDVPDDDKNTATNGHRYVQNDLFSTNNENK